MYWTAKYGSNSQPPKPPRMNEIINRIITAFRALFVKRIMFIELYHDKKRDRVSVTLWTTEKDIVLQANALRRLAESLEHDAQQEEKRRKLAAQN